MASLPNRLRVHAPMYPAMESIMRGISRQELKQASSRFIQPMEPAYVYEQARRLAIEAFDAAVAELTAALTELPAGVCAQFGVAEAEGEVWTFWLACERKPTLLWASGPRNAVFEDAIDPGHYEGISVHDAQIATRLIRAWLVSVDRKTVAYPAATLREARGRRADDLP